MISSVIIIYWVMEERLFFFFSIHILKMLSLVKLKFGRELIVIFANVFVFRGVLLANINRISDCQVFKFQASLQINFFASNK